MKRTCKRCWAHKFDPSATWTPPFYFWCDLDYKQANGKPQEECPKPLTLAQLENEYRKKRGLPIDKRGEIE